MVESQTWNQPKQNVFSKCFSCFQVKSPAQSEQPEDRDFEWDVLFERTLVTKVEIGEYGLPSWAGTWKIMNFPFRQQKKNWDCGWESYQQEPSDKSDKFDLIQEQLDQVGPLLSRVSAPNLTDQKKSVFWSLIRTSLKAGRIHGGSPDQKIRRTGPPGSQQKWATGWCRDGANPACWLQLLLRNTKSSRRAGAPAGGSSSRSGGFSLNSSRTSGRQNVPIPAPFTSNHKVSWLTPKR